MSNLLKNYDKLIHLKNIDNKKSLNFSYMFANKWEIEENIPYVLKTYLLDTYYCLPERPDMAFTFLWKCINNTYSAYQRKISNEVFTGDAKLLENMCDGIVDQLDDNINFDGKIYTIKDLIEKYIDKVPDKLLSFISSYILKSYVIKEIIDDERYVSSSYNTFKKKFANIYKIIESTYCKEYLKICSPSIDIYTREAELNIKDKDKDKSRKIVFSLSQKLKELIQKKQVILDNHTLNIDNSEYIQFIAFNILYAIRNNTVHGKIPSRLNSDYVNTKSYESSKYVYFLGYMFLSVMLYISNELELKDLAFNFKNIEFL